MIISYICMKNRLFLLIAISIAIISLSVTSCESTPKIAPDIPQYSVDQVLYIAALSAPSCTRSEWKPTFTTKYMGQGEWEVTMNCLHQTNIPMGSRTGHFHEEHGEMDWDPVAIPP